MPDWRCTRCGVVNLEGQRLCEGCGHESRTEQPARQSASDWKRPEWLDHPKPCTPEQGQRAVAIAQAVVNGAMTVEQARAKFAVLFGGREVES